MIFDPLRARRRRLLLGLRYVDVAARIIDAGHAGEMTESYISRRISEWLRGVYIPLPCSLKSLAMALDCEPIDLLSTPDQIFSRPITAGPDRAVARADHVALRMARGGKTSEASNVRNHSKSTKDN